MQCRDKSLALYDTNADTKAVYLNWILKWKPNGIQWKPNECRLCRVCLFVGSYYLIRRSFDSIFSVPMFLFVHLFSFDIALSSNQTNQTDIYSFENSIQSSNVSHFPIRVSSVLTIIRIKWIDGNMWYKWEPIARIDSVITSVCCNRSKDTIIQMGVQSKRCVEI